MDHVHAVAFVAPLACFRDARRYLPALFEKRGLDASTALGVLAGLERVVTPVAEQLYGGAREEALARIGARDGDDWPVLAAALTLNCPIWTEDQDFFGTGVATWTTDRVELYLKAALAE